MSVTADTQRSLGNQILLEAGTNELEVLVFHLGKHRYGINGAKVREVVKPPAIRPIPKSDPVLDGLCKLRDDVIPIVSLIEYFDVAKENRQEAIDNSQVIVTVFNEQSIAFRVERVDRIHRISWKETRPIPALFGSDKSLFTGFTVIEDQIVLMVDLERIAADLMGQKDHIEQGAKANKGQNLRGKTIVYCEDSRLVQAMATTIMRSAGCSNLHVFNNGAEAWDWLRTHGETQHVDAIVTDIEMPLMDGFHLSSKVRQDPKLRTTPIVLLSSLINADNERKGKSVGVNAQLVKTRIEELPHVLAGVLVA
ncbi:chemotaxis protein [bacterium]|nr:chemotaxis protein [bacterium]